MQPTSNRQLAALPLHPLPKLPGRASWRLLLGSAAEQMALSLNDIAALPHVDVVDPFTCLEGWTTGPLHWRGVLLSALLSLLKSDDPFVAVSAGAFCSVAPRASLPRDTLLADTLDGLPLSPEYGGPLRLVVPGGICYQSVKWVQQIALQTSEQGDTARQIAFARIGDRASE